MLDNIFHQLYDHTNVQQNGSSLTTLINFDQVTHHDFHLLKLNNNYHEFLFNSQVHIKFDLKKKAYRSKKFSFKWLKPIKIYYLHAVLAVNDPKISKFWPKNRKIGIFDFF